MINYLQQIDSLKSQLLTTDISVDSYLKEVIKLKDQYSSQIKEVSKVVGFDIGSAVDSLIADASQIDARKALDMFTTFVSGWLDATTAEFITSLTLEQVNTVFANLEGNEQAKIEWFLFLPLMYTAESDPKNFASMFIDIAIASTSDTITADPALQTVAEALRESDITLARLLGYVYISRLPAHADYMDAVLHLLYSNGTASGVQSNLTTGSVKDMLLAAVQLAEDIGASNAGLTALRAALENTAGITNLGFQEAVGTFLEAVWPGLATELSVPF